MAALQHWTLNPSAPSPRRLGFSLAASPEHVVLAGPALLPFVPLPNLLTAETASAPYFFLTSALYLGRFSWQPSQALLLPTRSQYELLVFPLKSLSIVANKPAVLYAHTIDIILDSSSLLALSCCLIIQIPPLIHLMCSCSQKLGFDLAMSRQEHWDLLPYDSCPARPPVVSTLRFHFYRGWRRATFCVPYRHLCLSAPLPVPCFLVLPLILSFPCCFGEFPSRYGFARADPPDPGSQVAFTFKSLLQTSFP